MPPRHTFWTILIDNQPTAFRAHDPEELLPTLNRLREKNPTAVMKWFERGQLFDSRDAARQAGLGQGERRWEGPRPERREDDDQESPRARKKDWRPGGEHRDPRQKYKDAKKAKWTRFKTKIRERHEERVSREPQSFTPPHGDKLRPRDDRNLRPHDDRNQRPRFDDRRDSRPDSRDERFDREQRNDRGGQGNRSDWRDRDDRGPRDSRDVRSDRGARSSWSDRSDRGDRWERNQPERGDRGGSARRGPDRGGSDRGGADRGGADRGGGERRERHDWSGRGAPKYGDARPSRPHGDTFRDQRPKPRWQERDTAETRSFKKPSGQSRGGRKPWGSKQGGSSRPPSANSRAKRPGPPRRRRDDDD